MPFTPLHMGPAIALKAVTGRHFSLMVFGFSQVAMDLEPLVRIIRDDTILHGPTHTYAGATLVGAISAVIGRPICQYFLNFWAPDSPSHFMNWLRGPEQISWPAAISAAFIGTYSHVVLDSIMHDDMHPLRPITDGNGLLHILSVSNLHTLCIASAAIGALILIGRFVLRR